MLRDCVESKIRLLYGDILNSINSYYGCKGLDIVGIDSKCCDRLLFRSELSEDSKLQDYVISDISDVISSLKLALNNKKGYEVFKSYTSSLAIALFKYNAEYLSYISHKVNVLRLRLQVDFYSWVDYNDYGDRNFYGVGYVDLPLDKIFDVDYCTNCIISATSFYNLDLEYQTLENYGVDENLCDIDNISFDIVGYIVKLCDMNKNRLNASLYKLGFGGLKPILSYNIDQEYVVYCEPDEIWGSCFDIGYCWNKDLIYCIKVLSILFMFDELNLASKYTEIIIKQFSGDDLSVFKVFCDYFSHVSFEIERIKFDEIMMNCGIKYNNLFDLFDKLQKPECNWLRYHDNYKGFVKAISYLTLII